MRCVLNDNVGWKAKLLGNRCQLAAGKKTLQNDMQVHNLQPFHVVVRCTVWYATVLCCLVSCGRDAASCHSGPEWWKIEYPTVALPAGFKCARLCQSLAGHAGHATVA